MRLRLRISRLLDRQVRVRDSDLGFSFRRRHNREHTHESCKDRVERSDFGVPLRLIDGARGVDVDGNGELCEVALDGGAIGRCGRREHRILLLCVSNSHRDGH